MIDEPFVGNRKPNTTTNKTNCNALIDAVKSASDHIFKQSQHSCHYYHDQHILIHVKQHFGSRL